MVKQINRDVALFNWNARRHYENSLSHILIRKHMTKMLTNSIYCCLNERDTFYWSIGRYCADLWCPTSDIFFFSCCNDEYVKPSLTHGQDFSVHELFLSSFRVFASPWIVSVWDLINLSLLKKDFNKERDREAVCNKPSSNVTNLRSILVPTEYAIVACEMKQVHCAFSLISEVDVSKSNVVSLARK